MTSDSPSQSTPTPPPASPSPSSSQSAPKLAFQPPSKRILTREQLVAFQQSPSHSEIVGFIEELNDAIKGVKLGDGEGEAAKYPIIGALVSMLAEVESIAKQTPPVPNAASRFGNPAFRDFYDRVNEASEALHEKYLAPLGLPKESIPEVKVYFDEMWGNRTRIDYGSGMELNWLCWTLCLKKLSLLPPATYPFIPTRVFFSGYIHTMRYLQSTYWLEPAGSHGVWGLDDYHFLPFLWGSGQLKGHKWIRPRAIHDAEVVEELKDGWMYFGCIGFINSIKTASLRWHSPMLDDISAVKTWDKVNSGMMKMYLAEVLGKLPVMQHFLFGTLIPFPSSPDPSHAPSPSEHQEETHAHGEACGHNHAPRNLAGIHPKVLASLQARGELPPDPAGTQNGGELGGAGQRDVGWGDCCGIPVPSVFGAAQEEKDRREGGSGAAGERGGYKLSGVRPVPFD